MENRIRPLIADRMVAAFATPPSDPRLSLIEPLVSRRMLNRGCIETQLAVETIGANGVKHLTAALLRELETDGGSERVLTMHTQVFASRGDSVPASTADDNPRLHSRQTQIALSA
jgi:hypothetical protein